MVGQSCGEPAAWLWAEESSARLCFALTAINISSPRLLDRMIATEID